MGSTAHARSGWRMPWKEGTQVHPAGSWAPLSCRDRQAHTVRLAVDSAEIFPDPDAWTTHLTVPGSGLSVTRVSNSPYGPISLCPFSGLPAAIVVPFSV